MTLSEDPERTVTIPISRANQGGASNGDYSGVPANVTFNSGDTEKTFSFSATDDTVDDDDESVKLSFGTLPTGVSEGTTTESGGLHHGRRRPPGERQLRAGDSYTVAEGSSVTVKVSAQRRPRAHGDHPHQQGQPGRGLQRGLLRRPGQRHLQQRRHREDLHLLRHRRHG